MTLAPIASIAFKREAVPASEFGRRPELKWLPLAQLRVDRAYQRDVLETGRATIKRIVEQFRWSKFGQLVVAPRGSDTYAVIDGQHRAIACACLGIDRAPCIVVACELEEEAEAFAAINSNVTRPSSLQIHAARLTAGDRAARQLKRVCDDAGVTVPRYAVTCDQIGMTTAITTLQSCLAKFGPEVLTRALKLIVGTGGGQCRAAPHWHYRGAVRRPEGASRAGRAARQPACRARDVADREALRQGQTHPGGRRRLAAPALRGSGAACARRRRNGKGGLMPHNNEG